MIGPYFTELHLQPHFGEKNVTETGHSGAKSKSHKYTTLLFESYWNIFTQSIPKSFSLWKKGKSSSKDNVDADGNDGNNGKSNNDGKLTY